MLSGYVVNNSGRGSHIFKRPVAPGAKVKLDDLYLTYKSKYGGDLDSGFVSWLSNNKLRPGFDVVVSSEDEVKPEKEQQQKEENKKDDRPITKSILPNNLTAKQIAELRIVEDKAKDVIAGINSVHKLRRAVTLCKGRKGKETLLRFVRDRISEL